MEAPLALYRRYRPETFSEVIGQDHVTVPLRNALSNNRVNHAYLFSGPRGCGKTTSARILARAINCEKGPIAEPCGVCKSCTDLARGGPGSIDVIEIDAASHGGVDDARDLRERAFFAPVESRYKIYIIDEAHMVTTQGFNALLKLVEEPPPHLKFIFATTEPDKVIGTIRSRTHHYPFRLVPPKALADYMATLCTAEGVTIEPAALPLVVRAGAGSVRDSLSVLDQLIGGADAEGVTYRLAVQLLGFTPDSLLDACVDGFAAHDSKAVFETIEKVIETGQDPKRFAEDLLRRLRDLVILSAVPNAVASGLIEAAEDQGERLQTQAAGIGPAELTRAADIVAAGLLEMRGATAPRLQLELICAKVLLPGADDSTNGIQARLDRMERRLTIGTPPGTTSAIPGNTAVAGTAGPPAQVAPTQPPPPAPGQAPGPAAGGQTGSPGRPEPAHQESPGPDSSSSATAASATPAKSAASASNQPSGSTGSAGDQGTAADGGRSGAWPDESGTSAPSKAAASTIPAAPAQTAPPATGSQTAPAQGAPAQGAPAQAAGSQAVSGQVAPAGVPATGSSSGSVGLADVRRLWPEILEAVKSKRRFAWIMLSQNAQVIAIDEQTLTLGLVNAGARESFARSGSDEILRQAMIDTIGLTRRVEAVVDPSTDPGGGTPATPTPPPPTDAPTSTWDSPPSSAPTSSWDSPQPRSTPTAAPDSPPPAGPPTSSWDSPPPNGAPNSAPDSPPPGGTQNSAWNSPPAPAAQGTHPPTAPPGTPPTSYPPTNNPSAATAPGPTSSTGNPPTDPTPTATRPSEAPGVASNGAPGDASNGAPGAALNGAPGGASNGGPGNTSTASPGGTSNGAPGGAPTSGPGGASTSGPGGASNSGPGGASHGAPGGAGSAADGAPGGVSNAGFGGASEGGLGGAAGGDPIGGGPSVNGSATAGVSAAGPANGGLSSTGTPADGESADLQSRGATSAHGPSGDDQPADGQPDGGQGAPGDAAAYASHSIDGGGSGGAAGVVQDLRAGNGQAGGGNAVRASLQGDQQAGGPAAPTASPNAPTDRRAQAASKRRAAEAAVAAEQGRRANAPVQEAPLTPEEEAMAIGEDDVILEEDSRSHTDLLRDTLGAQIILEETN